MNKLKLSLLTQVVATVAFCMSAGAQDVSNSPLLNVDGVFAKVERTIPGVGTVLLPESSVKRPEDRGRRAHTHHKILKLEGEPLASEDARPRARGMAVSPQLTAVETPASLACVYRLVTQIKGCDPDKVSQVASGGSRVIAIVDAYHNKTALKDLKKFSSTFGLPVPDLQIEYCSATSCKNVSTPPRTNRGWAGEIALDLQWAHAMAPDAKLILVEAHSANFDDLLRAVDRAAQLVAAAGGGQVSMSWGGEEFAGQEAFDDHFVQSGVVFFASTGDHQNGTTAPDVNWPATSPNVVAVGGTRVVRRSTGAFNHETAWVDSGGGKSAIYERLGFQRDVAAKTGNHRAVPDVAWNADPASGAVVYCSAGTCATSGGFFVFGGTSLASPAVAAMTNNAGHFRRSSAAQHNAIYNGLGTPRFTDVVGGKCGNGAGGNFVNAGTGWDLCTGVGTPKGLSGL